MTIKRVLLLGVCLQAIGLSAADAKSAPPLVARLIAGRAAVKTSLHSQRPSQLSSTQTIFSTVSTSADYKKKKKLIETYYTFLNSGTFCDPPRQNVKLAKKKTAHAKLSTSTVTYSEGCGTPTVFYGDVYDLTTKKGVGKTDKFFSTLIGHDLHYDGEILKKATLELLVEVNINK